MTKKERKPRSKLFDRAGNFTRYPKEWYEKRE